MEKSLKNYLDIFFTFLKIGLFTFGGGLAMISLIEKEFVDKKKWIEKDNLMDMVAISESTPGPLAINMATYIGYKSLGFFGALLATIGVVIPSFVIILIISLFLSTIMENETVQHFFIGINCAVFVLIFNASVSLLKTLKKDILSVTLFILSLGGSLSILYFSINFSQVFIILIGAFISLVYYFVSSFIHKKKEGK